MVCGFCSFILQYSGLGDLWDVVIITKEILKNSCLYAFLKKWSLKIANWRLVTTLSLPNHFSCDSQFSYTHGILLQHVIFNLSTSIDVLGKICIKCIIIFTSSLGNLKERDTCDTLKVKTKKKKKIHNSCRADQLFTLLVWILYEELGWIMGILCGTSTLNGMALTSFLSEL